MLASGKLEVAGSFQLLASHIVQAPLQLSVASGLDKEVFSLIICLHDKVSKGLDVWPGAASFQVHNSSLISSLNEDVSPIPLLAWLEASQLRMISVALCMFPMVPKILILELSMWSASFHGLHVLEWVAG